MSGSEYSSMRLTTPASQVSLSRRMSGTKSVRHNTQLIKMANTG